MTTTEPTAAPTPDAKSFDINGFLANFEQAHFPVRVPTRADLLPKIEELRKQIDDFPEDEEMAVSDTGSRNKLIREHNKLVEEFEANHLKFVFRPGCITDEITARAKAKDAGLDFEADGSAEQLLSYRWAETCIEPAGITAEAFNALRQKIGDIALGILAKTWEAASYGGSNIDAPFSPRPLPIPTSGKRSSS